MSEVKRYYVNLDHGTRYSPVDGCDQTMNKAEDFDRVTAERDAALGRESRAKEGLAEHWKVVCDQRAKIEALQQRLTAADERADVLEGLLRRSMLAMSRIYEAGRDFIVGSGSDCDSVELMMENDPTAREIRAALKPADTAKCERCGCSTVETCDERGCGYLGAGNGAPE
ncbi:hypothetical protein ACM9HO_03270 [Pseudomonas sp. KHB2.9]